MGQSVVAFPPMSRLPRLLLWASYHFRGPALCDTLRGADIKVLMYHGISRRTQFDRLTNCFGYNVPAAEFEAQLDYLHRQCNVVSLRDLRSARGLSRKKTNVILTFDDGYENNYTTAFPLLKRYGMPAVYALPTAFVCGREPLWNDIIEYAINESAREGVSLHWNGTGHEFELTGALGRFALYRWMMRECTQMDQDRRDALIGLAAGELQVSVNSEAIFKDEDYRPLTREQVREMSESGLIEFASHSVHHYALSKFNTAGQRFELQESKRQIEEWTGIPCTAFCVPGGAYNREVLEEAFSAGYESVLTSDVGNTTAGRRVINRLGVFHKDGIYKFADQVHGPVLKLLAMSRRARGSVRKKFRKQ